MKLYIHHTSGEVTTGVRVRTRIGLINAVHRNTLPLEVFFHDGVEVITLPDDAYGRVVVKAEADPLGPALLTRLNWSLPATTDAGYLFKLLVDGEGLRAALGSLAEKTFDLEIVWFVDGERFSTRPIDLVVAQTFYNGDEAEIVPLPDLLTPYQVANAAARLALNPADADAPLRFGQTVLQLDTGTIWSWKAASLTGTNNADAWVSWTGPQGPQGIPGTGANEATEEQSRDTTAATGWISPRRFFARGDERWARGDLASKGVWIRGKTSGTLAAGVILDGGAPAPGARDFTQAGWIYVNEFGAINPAAIFGNVNFEPGLSLRLHASGFIDMHHISGPPAWSAIAVPSPLRRWLFLAASRINGLAYFFCNGQQLGDPVPDTTTITGNAALIGDCYYNGWDAEGDIIIVRASQRNYGLTAAEHVALHARGGLMLPEEAGASYAALNGADYWSGSFTASISATTATSCTFSISPNGRVFIALPARKVLKGQRFRVSGTKPGTVGVASSLAFWQGSIGGTMGTAIPLPDDAGAFSFVLEAGATAEAPVFIDFNFTGPVAGTLGSIEVLHEGVLWQMPDADRHCGRLLPNISGSPGPRRALLLGAGAEILNPARGDAPTFREVGGTFASQMVGRIPPEAVITSIHARSVGLDVRSFSLGKTSGGADIVGFASADANSWVPVSIDGDIQVSETGEIWLSPADDQASPIEILVRFTLP